MTMCRFFAKPLLFLAIVVILPTSSVASQPAGTPVSEAPPEAPVLIFAPDDTEGQHYFDIELEAGEHATLSVQIGNGGVSPLEVLTYAADGYTIRNGGFGLLDSTSQD